MMTVIGRAIAEQLGVDVRVAFFGMALLFQDQDAGALGKNKTVSVLVEGPGSGRRVVVSRAERAGGTKRGQPDGSDSRLGAAGDHDVTASGEDVGEGFADCMIARGAGARYAEIGAAQPVANCDIAAAGVGHEPRHAKRRNLARTFVQEPYVLVFDLADTFPLQITV